MAAMDLKQLLVEHAEAIQQLRAALHDLLASEHDDIFILRFVMSHGAKAETVLRRTIAFRSEWHDLLQKVRAEGKPPHDSVVRRYSDDRPSSTLRLHPTQVPRDGHLRQENSER